jgi:vancomycin resistance protein VanW
MKIEKKIEKLIENYKTPKREALTKKYPKFKKPIIFVRRFIQNIQNFFNFHIKYSRKKHFFNCVVARHQSVLRRKLGDSNPRLQEQKIQNLKQAIKRLNGVVIKPGDIFSFWQIIGNPTYKKGYVNGMLLSNGEVIEGLGGGLCQLSNFLYWIFLHTPTETVERYHHSKDVFPDSGRVLPFGSGATVLYNFVDLKIKNTSNEPLQLKIWLTDKHLKGKILAPKILPKKFHIFEKNHLFAKKDGEYFRYNEIFRETKINGKIIKTEKITENFAPVLYKVTPEYLQENSFKVLDLGK